MQTPRKNDDLTTFDTRSALTDEERHAVRRERQRAALHLVPNVAIGKFWVPAIVARSFSRGL
jgi:acetaldehyde dehydrogenase (acetylating)